MVGYLGLGERLGAYRVDAELGRGGMGTVYRATHLPLNRPVALKILDPKLAADPVFVERFHREAAILASLDSPHIIRIFDHGEIDGHLYLATQYVAGGDLHELVRGSGPLRPETALQVYGQILSAVGDAHKRGIVHRDVKPSNVLLHPDVVEPFAYLCDFGIAQSKEAGLTEAGAVAGSWAYMSPERQTGSPATPQSDIYSAACVLWFMLTGRGVYTGTDVEVAMAHLHSAVPQLRGVDPLLVELNRIFRTCLAKDPAERPATAAEALALSRDCQPLAVGTIPLDLNSPDSGIFRTTLKPGDPGPLADPARRSGRRVGLLVAAGVAALAVGATATMLVLPTQARSALTAVAQPGASPSGPSASSASDPPAPGYLCWDAQPAADLSACTNPSGRSGLRYLYPSLGEQWADCKYVAYRSTTDAYDCTIKHLGLIRYRYWTDVAEANQHYSQKYAKATETDLVLDGNVVGTLYRLPRPVAGEYRMSGFWLDGHFSFSVEAPTKAQREQLFKLVQLRGYDQLTGKRKGADPTIGVLS